MTNFVTHNLDNKYTAVGSCCCMDSVNRICCDINCTLESKCHVCSPQIVIDCLRQCHYIESFLAKKICCLMSSISSKNNKTIQMKLMICVFHCLHLVYSILVRHTHQFERLTGCTKNCSTLCQDSREIP